MKKIIILLLLGVFMISFVSAFDFDNSGKFIKDQTTSRYGKYEIKNIFGLGKKIIDIELKNNSDICGQNCFAEKEITLYEDGVLVDDIIFKTLQEDGSWIDQPIRSYSFSYYKGENKIKYIEGEVVEAGTYILRLDGKKKPTRTVDWIIKSNGIWTDEWSIWGGGNIVEEVAGSFSPGSSSSDRFGINLTATINFTLVSINKTNGGQVTKAYLYFSNGTQIGSTKDFVGDKAIFNTNLINGITYYIVTDDNGASYDRNESTITGSTFNYFNLHGTIFQTPPSTFGGSSDNPIQFLEVDDLNSNVQLNSPENDSGFDNISIQFNASAQVVGGATLDNRTLYVWFSNGTLLGTNTTTGLSGTSETANDTIIGLIDGSFLWNKEYCDSDGDCGFSILNNSFNIDTLFPTILVESPSGILNYNFIGGNETINVTFTDTALDTCWFDYNGTNVTIEGCITGIKNSTNFILENNNLNMTIYANDTSGNLNSTFVSWDYKILELNRTFSESAFETDSKLFSINLSANSTLSSVNLIYDGTSKTTTLTNNISTVTFDIPTSTGVKELFWSFNYGSEVINSSTSNQTVNGINFNFCNATLTVPYINFSFKNETISQESLNATIDSSWSIWLGGGGETKAFTLTNSSENPNYTICFSASNETLNTNVTLNYNNGQSQQRNFVSEPILTNSTTQQTLFLLPSFLGLFSQFQARDIANNPISLVKGTITRTLDSSIVSVASFFTDSSGIVIFFLNPDIVYTATFSKAGFVDNVFTFVPTTDLRFVTMGSGVSVNGSNISIGTLYQIGPASSTLANNTLTTFTFNVTGSDDITLISMNITDGNDTSLGFDSNAGVGNISVILNTSNNNTLTGIFKIQTGDETLIISKTWIIGNEFEGDYSISKQGKLLLQYEFSDFIRLAMVVLIMFGVVIFMSSNELADNNESKIAVVILMIWGFSFIGWLNNPAVVSTTGIAQHARQYGIAILSTGGALFFFIRRIFV